MTPAGGARREGHTPAKFDGDNLPSAGKLASRLVTVIRLRNYLTVVTALRRHGVAGLGHPAAGEARRGLPQDHRRRRNAKVLKRASPFQFDSASDRRPWRRHVLEQEAGLQNTPATAPVALYYPDRAGGKAQACWTGWMPSSTTRNRACTATTADRPRRRTGVGECHLHVQPGPGPRRPAELGGDANLEQGGGARGGGGAQSLTVRAPLMGRKAAVLRPRETGDGGLFTGVLVRYLALAAVTNGSPPRPGPGGPAS